MNYVYFIRVFVSSFTTAYAIISYKLDVSMIHVQTFDITSYPKRVSRLTVCMHMRCTPGHECVNVVETL